MKLLTKYGFTKPIYGFRKSIACFALAAPLFVFAHTETTSTYSSADTGGGTASSGEVSVSGDSSASAEIHTDISDGGASVRIETEVDGKTKVQTFIKPTVSGNVRVSTTATSSGGETGTGANTEVFDQTLEENLAASSSATVTPPSLGSSLWNFGTRLAARVSSWFESFFVLFWR